MKRTSSAKEVVDTKAKEVSTKAKEVDTKATAGKEAATAEKEEAKLHWSCCLAAGKEAATAAKEEAKLHWSCCLNVERWKSAPLSCRGPSLSCWNLQNAEHRILPTFLVSCRAWPSGPLYFEALAACEAVYQMG